MNRSDKIAAWLGAGFAGVMAGAYAFTGEAHYCGLAVTVGLMTIVMGIDLAVNRR